VIRAAVPADAEALAAVYAPYVTGTAVSFEENPPTPDEVRARMAGGLPWLVAEDRGGLLGFAYASPHRARAAYRWAVDVSVYLAPDARGRGLGTALYAVLLPLLADLGYASAHAGIALPNEPSVRLHERQGFVPVGVYRQVGFKLGRWHDVGWWQRALGRQPAVPGSAPGLPPAEPRAWDGSVPPS
jgi:phosphinothricin acetyltransferase